MTAACGRIVLVHGAVPGRARFHLASLRRHERLCRRVEDALAARPDVHMVRACPWTGNVLVNFGPDLTLAEIRGWLEALGAQGGEEEAESEDRFPTVGAASVRLRLPTCCRRTKSQTSSRRYWKTA